jgi:Aspartate/tyrosine/aromatic aminotransferase
MLSSRVTRLKESATLKMMERAKALEARGVRVISLDVGEPDFPTPREVVDAAYRAMLEGYTHYTPSKGLPELRRAIVEKLRRDNGIDVTADQVLVTPGAKQALFYLFMALLDEGDEVIVATPAWPSYWEMVSVAGGVVKEAPPSDGYGLNLEAIEGLVTDRTKAIVVNSPNNPSGAVFSREDMEGLVELASRRKLIVISDEIYEKILYEGTHVSPASLPGGEETVVVVNGFSKTFAMTGWRLGYLAGPRQIVDAATKLQQHSATCAPAFAQKRPPSSSPRPTGSRDPWSRSSGAARDFIVSALTSLGFRLEPPRGAFYVFPELPDSEPDSTAFVERALEAGVSMTDGKPFGGFSRNVRISYANSLENLREAMERLSGVLKGDSKTANLALQGGVKASRLLFFFLHEECALFQCISSSLRLENVAPHALHL